MGITEKFVLENPGLTVMGILLLIGIIKFLTSILSKLVTQPYNNLTKAIEGLNETVKDIKEDRKTDQQRIGLLLDRMQKQETLCTTTRQFCPHIGIGHVKEDTGI